MAVVVLVVAVVVVEVATVVLVLVVLVVHICPGEPSNIPCLSAVVSHAPQRVCAKDDAEANM